jgi:hypothetical protein
MCAIVARMTPATDWKEVIGADEDTRFNRYAEQLVALSARRSQGAAPTRALHPKMNLGVVAEFSVLPGLLGLSAAPLLTISGESSPSDSK